MITTTAYRFGLGLTGIALLGWPAVAPAQDPPPLLEIVAEPGHQDDPATAFNPFSLSFLVVWDQREDPDRDIESAINGRLVTPRFPLRNGEVRLGDILTISDNEGAEVDEPALAVSKRGNVVVTWEQTVDEEGRQTSFATLLDRKGRTIKDPFRLGPDTNCDLNGTHVAYNSRKDQWLVIWVQQEFGTDEDCRDTRGVKGVILDRRADPVGDVFDISEPGIFVTDPFPASDSKRGHYLVAWIDEEDESVILGQQLAASGELIGDDFVIVSDDGGDPVLVYDRRRDQYLAGWTHDASDPSRIEARFVEGGSGDLGDRFFISDGARDDASDAAFALRGFLRYLVIWEEDTVLPPDDPEHMYGQSLRRNGNLIGDNFVLADDPELNQEAPSDIHLNLDCIGPLCLTLWEQSLPEEGGEQDIAGRLLFTQP